MKKILATVLCLTSCILLLCSFSCSARNGIGTITEVSGERVVVTLTDDALGRQLAFTQEENKLTRLDVVVGDIVSVTYMGPLVPPCLGDTDVRSWGLISKEMDGILLSLDENQAVVRPMPDDPLADQVEELMFLRNNRDLQRDIGVSVGDAVSITYVRDVIPGNPPQIEAKDWGVYVDWDVFWDELMKRLEEP